MGGGKTIAWATLGLAIALSLAHVACGATEETASSTTSTPDGPSPPRDCHDCGGESCWVNPDMPGCPQARSCYLQWQQIEARYADGAVDGGADAGGVGPVELLFGVEESKRNPSFADDFLVCTGCTVVEKAIAGRQARIVLDVTETSAKITLRYTCSVNSGFATFRVTPNASSVDVEAVEIADLP